MFRNTGRQDGKENAKINKIQTKENKGKEQYDISYLSYSGMKVLIA
jgi:hypothetical protein